MRKWSCIFGYLCIETNVSMTNIIEFFEKPLFDYMLVFCLSIYLLIYLCITFIHLFVSYSLFFMYLFNLLLYIFFFYYYTYVYFYLILL